MVTRHFLCGRSMMILDTAACLSILNRSSRMRMSSCSSLPYSPLLAYQRESKVRLMPRRRPIGLTFCPIACSSSPGRCRRFDLAHDDGQIRKRLLDPPGAAARTRRKALEHETLADKCLGDDEIVDIEIMIIFSVGDRAFERLLDVDRDALTRK